MNEPKLWRTTPLKSRIVFLSAVFVTFAAVGIANDVTDMGAMPPLRFGITLAMNGIFAVCYAVSGLTLRRRVWKACLPLFALQFLCMRFVFSRLPETPQLAQLSVAQTGALHTRLAFDGTALIILVVLGYIGFVGVSVSEGKRHIQAESQKALLEGEMIAAREVQRALVPETLPALHGYHLETVYRPAAEVGGDFFQVIPLPSGRTLVVIGDVSGKGLRAAMIVSMIVGALHTVSSFSEEPSAILAQLNRRLCGRMNEGFATCLAVRLEDDGRITLANAGHLPPYLNSAELAFSGSLPLGVLPSASYEQSSLELAPDDVFVLLTDGIAEAQNPQRALLGFPRVESLLRQGASAHSLAETAQHHGQQDDLTVLRITRAAVPALAAV